MKRSRCPVTTSRQVVSSHIPTKLPTLVASTHSHSMIQFRTISRIVSGSRTGLAIKLGATESCGQANPHFFRGAHNSTRSLSTGKLDGRVAIVTGSTDGIGFAVAKKMADDGAKVVISSRKQHNVDKALQELKEQYPDHVDGVVCHVGKDEDQQKLVDFTLERFGSIDVLVSNVAVNPYFGSILDMQDSQWDKIFEVNVKSPFLLTKKVVPHMLKNNRPNDKGAIVYVSSIAAYSGMVGLGAYSISKTALLGLCKNMSSELAVDGIRVNLVAPGVIKTKFSNVLWENDGDNEYFKSLTHMKRLGESHELGGIAVSIATSDSNLLE